jgi:GH15 family glucan-1,4-alpha-glucosidase
MTSRPEATPAIPPLDHAAIGNGRVLALVSPRASIDWLCLPRFDSPAVFARLLDEQKGGSFRLLSGGEERRGELSYVPNTNVARTRFERDGAAFEVLDFAPRIPEGFSVHAPIEIVRLIRPLSGEPRLSVDFDPRPDFGRRPVQFVEEDRGVRVVGCTHPLQLVTNLPIAWLLGKRDFVLTAPTWFVLRWGARDERPNLAQIEHDLDRTIRGWRLWAKTCALPHFEPELVLRSALCLVLHASLDTGAIIASATTSIPEAMGTERTWDYRYCWLRDSAFVVEALRRLSHLNEGERFLHYLRMVVDAGPLQPVYGIGGERELPEEFLPHLAGFGGNGHVRIGNAACTQTQHDLMGEVVLCLETVLTDPRIVHDQPESYFRLIEDLVERAIAAAETPDTGIWEFRTIFKQYTFSQAMCWAAAHRGELVARRFGHEDQARRWGVAAARLQERVLTRGFNASLGFFTEALDGKFPDASNLLLPSIGLIDARDPRFVSTVRAYEERLVVHGAMLRYRHPDDFGETESAFTMCSFWWAEALALMGELDRAIEVFRRTASYANPVGLLSEDIDPKTRALLGNFPQAYTHVGLIHAATTIGELLDARDGRVRAWV